MACGYAVDVLCLRQPGQDAGEVVGGVSTYRVPVRHLQGNKAIPYFSEYLRFFVLAFWHLTRRALQTRYDLIHVYNPPDILVFTTLLPRLLTRAKVLFDVRDIAPELFMARFRTSEDHLIPRTLRAHERWACRYADAVTVCTVTQREYQAKRDVPAEKITIVMNHPDEALYGPPLEPVLRTGPDFSVVFHGAIVKRYGLDSLIQAASILHGQIPNLKFNICGAGDHLPAAQQLAVDLGIGGIVRFHGYIPHQDMLEIVRSANVGIVPVPHDQFTDTVYMPTKLMEYAHMGVPAVATRTNTISAYFDDDMVSFVESNSPEELAQQILKLYRDPAAALEQARRACRFREKYNWNLDKVVYVRLVDRLLGGPS